jgi:hypothetical protein
MEATTLGTTSHPSEGNLDSDAWSREMRVRFDAEELSSFFDGFEALELPLGLGGEPYFGE